MNSICLYFAGLISHILPATRCWHLKRILYTLAGAKIGRGVKIVSSVNIMGSGQLEIGANTWIGHDCMIMCSSMVKIGENCDIGPRVYIGDGTHLIDPLSNRIAGDGVAQPIDICDGCWLCANTTVLPGTHIGSMSIIAAGSVVKGVIPGHELWAGSLAAFKKKLQ